MPAALPLWLLLPPVLALGGGAVRVVVVADDPALGRAVVRSAIQHVAGPIVLAPVSAPTPHGALRLQIRKDGVNRLQLVLSRGGVRVRRTLQLGGQPRSFDIAEAVAIALPVLRSQLEELTLRRPAQPALPKESSVVALLVEPPGPPAPPGPPGPEAARAEPAPPPPPAPAPPPQVIAPRITAPPPQVVTPQVAAPRSAAWRWQLGLGAGFTALGLAAVSLGAASLALDGSCADSALPCEYRYDGRRAGAAELALGGAAALAGVGLVIAASLRARREGRPVKVLALPAGPGLAVVGAF